MAVMARPDVKTRFVSQSNRQNDINCKYGTPAQDTVIGGKYVNIVAVMEQSDSTYISVDFVNYIRAEM